MRVIDCSDSKSFLEKVELIPKQLHIVRYRNKKSPYWYALVKLLKGQGKSPSPRSLKTTDQNTAQQSAYEVWRELTSQFKETGSVSSKSIKALCNKWVAYRKLLRTNGERGGSDSNTRGHIHVIGTLVPSFCDFMGYKKPMDFGRDFSSQYIKWRKEESPKMVGLDLEGNQKRSANTTITVPGESTIFIELQRIRQWSQSLVEDEELLLKPIKIPVRNSYVPQDEDDFESNPPFEPSDFEQIDEAYQNWVWKKDHHMDRKLKAIIYAKFVIDCSVGWRPYSEGLKSKWSWIQKIYVETQTIKGKERTMRNARIRIIDSKRKCIREGHFIRGQLFMELHDLYKVYADKDSNCIRCKRDGYIFYNPLTGKPLSTSQCYDHFKNRLEECNLIRDNYTYYSCRSYMVTERGHDGARPDVIAEFTGHDLRILKNHYQRLNIDLVSPMATIRRNTGLYQTEINDEDQKNIFTAFQ